MSVSYVLIPYINYTNNVLCVKKTFSVLKTFIYALTSVFVYQSHFCLYKNLNNSTDDIM